MIVSDADQYNTYRILSGHITGSDVSKLTAFFQAAAKGLTVDGKLGPLTLHELRVPGGSPGAWRFQWPLPTLPSGRQPQITSGFRTRHRPDHNGVDLFYKWEPGDQPAFVGDGGCEGRNADGTPRWVVPYGTSALAVAAGIVSTAGPSPTGFRCWVDHGNGLRTGYFHLEQLNVVSGTPVRAGDSLGLVGHSPRGIDGRHLHFEVSPVGVYRPMDPQPFLPEAP